MRALARWMWLGLVMALVSCGQPALTGTMLEATPAPDFTLIDQDGQEVHLASLRGQVVALTFLYSTCPDICPVVSQKLRQTYEALGSDADKVELLVVSVDPERDTVEQLRLYTESIGMTGRWHFLTGERDALARVWAAYGIGVFPGPNGAINHADAIYLIDKDGQRRVLMRSDVQPDELVSNLRILIH